MDSAGGFTRSGQLFLDPFYDGSLTIAQSAYTVEQQNGDISDAVTSVNMLTVDPLIDEARTHIYFADVNGNALDTIALTEGDLLGKTVRLYASSSDLDEVVTILDFLPEGLSVTLKPEGVGYKEYQITAQSSVAETVEQPLSVRAQVKIEDSGVSKNLASELNISLTKVATTPRFTETELLFRADDGQRDINFALPRIIANSQPTNDTLTYRLEGIPKWMTLVTPAGSLISSSPSLYSLEFEKQELADLSWRFDRDFLVSENAPDASATLTWLAVHTEPSNFKKATDAHQAYRRIENFYKVQAYQNWKNANEAEAIVNQPSIWRQSPFGFLGIRGERLERERI